MRKNNVFIEQETGGDGYRIIYEERSSFSLQNDQSEIYLWSFEDEKVGKIVT